MTAFLLDEVSQPDFVLEGFLKKIGKAAQDTSFEGMQLSSIFFFENGKRLLILHCTVVPRE